LEAVLEERGQEGAAVREVPVEGPATKVRLLRDEVERGVRAMGPEDLGRCPQEDRAVSSCISAKCHVTTLVLDRSIPKVRFVPSLSSRPPGPRRRSGRRRCG